MSLSNRDRIGKALDILQNGLKPFVQREMEAAYGKHAQYRAADVLYAQHFSKDGQEIVYDIQALLFIMWGQWKEVFGKTLGHPERSYVSELREVRNKWAHQNAFSSDDTYRALDTIERLLTAITASNEAEEVGKLKYELMRIRFDDQRRTVTRKITGPLGEGSPVSGLQPWRDVITPHPDVASGNYQVAEFAADLSQVYHDRGADEYRKPIPFFRRTFLTNGLSLLLSNALRRLSGVGGDPVVELQTNFGGGKTHSLLALYHLFSGVSAADLPGIEPVLASAGVQQTPKARRAVLVGSELSPAQDRKKPDGCVVNTLWGELAWQLLGQEGYAMVAEADRLGASPGSAILRELFERASPCLILIDEWVVFARQLYTRSDYPAGTFDANLSFTQALTEAAKAAPRTLAVISIPASDGEQGGEGGREAATRLRNIVGRVESPWRPADKDESFEIVRRRLFEPIEADLCKARDAVARIFVDFYRSQRTEFPAECGESDYERRIIASYPIHPELFDRLFNDWASIEKFQRTRGVLRLMAAVVHTLWEQQDRSLLILPASIPVDAPYVQSLFTQYLDDNWVPIIEKDIDGVQSLSRRLDQSSANLGRFSACRRVARTIFMGSAPTVHSAKKGIPSELITLGCVQPGESVAVFGDALRRLIDDSTYLDQNKQHYWYSTQQNVTRLAQDRAARYDDDTIFETIKEQLKIEQQERGDFVRVHPCPVSSADIADDDAAVRLVILKPQATHGKNDPNSQAHQEAFTILNYRGNAPRNYRNTLVFLAPDRTGMEALKQTARMYLAWRSIEHEHEILDLTAMHYNQAKIRCADEYDRLQKALPGVYSWLLIPEQLDPRGKDTLAERKLMGQLERGWMARRVSHYLKTEELLIPQWAGVHLRLELERIPLWDGNHISIKKLADHFARYIYLPRLKSVDTLLGAIRDGVQSSHWERETFAFADSWDESRQRYLGLKTGQVVNVVLNSTAVLVKSAVAAAQIAADQAEAARQAQQASVSLSYAAAPEHPAPVVFERGPESPRETQETDTVSATPSTPSAPSQPALFAPSSPVPLEPKLHRFHGSVQIDPRRTGSNAGTIMEEVIKHLTGLYGAKVQVTLEIQAELPDGIPDHVVRTVMENCRTLRFHAGFGFEES